MSKDESNSDDGATINFNLGAKLAGSFGSVPDSKSFIFLLEGNNKIPPINSLVGQQITVKTEDDTPKAKSTRQRASPAPKFL